MVISKFKVKTFDLATFLKYILHGVILSLLSTALGFGGAFFLLFLGFLSFGILLIPIMIYVIPALVGVANSIVTRLLWHGMEVTWLGVWIHGGIMLVLLILTNYLFITIPEWFFPDIPTLALGFIIASFINGYVGKYIAKFRKER